MQGIIDIRASRRIDATNGIRCQITTSLTILLGDGPWHGGQAVQYAISFEEWVVC